MMECDNHMTARTSLNTVPADDSRSCVDAGRFLQATRRITRASAAAAALAAADPTPQQSADQASGATAAVSQPAVSKSQGAEPSIDAEVPLGCFVAHQEETSSPAAETSGEVQGMLHSLSDDDCESAPADANHSQQTPAQQAAQQQEAAMTVQSGPSWRRLEARMEGVLPIWSIFKRFGRRHQQEH